MGFAAYTYLSVNVVCARDIGVEGMRRGTGAEADSEHFAGDW